MAQENLGLLLRLLSNYVNHCKDVKDAKAFLRTVADYPSQTLTDEKKSEMYWQTVHTLNAGNEEAAFFIRLKALCSGDDELVDKVEYLHEVL